MRGGFVSDIAKKVYMIVRKPHLRASKVMQQRVFDKENIELLFNTNTEGLFGEEFLEGAHLIEHAGTDQERRHDILIDGFFLAMGQKPNTDVFKPWLEMDESGYLKLEGVTSQTNIPGVFAAGDVADPHYRQAVVAAGAGCRAALDAERYLGLL